MSECSKCKSSCEGGSIYVEGGVSYPFCMECMKVLETFPSPNLILNNYLTPDEKQSQEFKNIIEARKRRINGKKIWIC